MELAIDTSTRYAGICLSSKGQALAEVVWHCERNHTLELASKVQDLLDQTGNNFGNLHILTIAQGPGNFSALRVGMSYMKGLALALQIPLVPVATLDIEASPYLGLGLPVYALLEAGRGEIVWSLFSDGQRSDPKVSPLQDLTKQIDRPSLICGEGAFHLRESLSQLLPDHSKIATFCLPSRQPAVLAALGYERFLDKHHTSIATLQPLYARGPTISKPREPRPRL